MWNVWRHEDVSKVVVKLFSDNFRVELDVVWTRSVRTKIVRVTDGDGEMVRVKVSHSVSKHRSPRTDASPIAIP